MLIRMNSSRAGSTDGINVRTYVAGEVYDLSSELLTVFLGERWADEVVSGVIPAETGIELPAEFAVDGPVETKNPKRRRK